MKVPLLGADARRVRTMIVGATDQEIAHVGPAHFVKRDFQSAGHLVNITCSMPTAKATSHITEITKATVSRFLPCLLQGITNRPRPASQPLPFRETLPQKKSSDMGSRPSC